jgi:hypothetical protein
MRKLVFFLASPIGRVLRLVVGFSLIVTGWFALTGIALYALIALGVGMMLAAFADVCLLAPLIGLSVSDELLREQSSRRQHLL